MSPTWQALLVLKKSLQSMSISIEMEDLEHSACHRGAVLLASTPSTTTAFRDQQTLVLLAIAVGAWSASSLHQDLAIQSTPPNDDQDRRSSITPPHAIQASIAGTSSLFCRCRRPARFPFAVPLHLLFSISFIARSVAVCRRICSLVSIPATVR